MRHRAVAPEVEVPPVGLLVEADGLEALLEHVEALLALRAADELSHARHQQVHRRHRLLVVVHAHVEGLDARGVVVHDGRRALAHHLGQVALVLALQVGAPLDGELELMPVLDGRLQRVHGLRVRDAAEGRLHDLGELVLQALLDALVEEFEVLRAVLEHGGHAVLEVGLGARHVVRQVGEGHLGLDHPELGEVARRVGVLRAEGGAEGVHVAQRRGVRLGVELPRHGQEALLAEEVLGEVERA